MSRYAEELRELGVRVEMDDLIEFIDVRRVCTTCGWGPSFHTHPELKPGASTICTSYTRADVDN